MKKEPVRYLNGYRRTDVQLGIKKVETKQDIVKKVMAMAGKKNCQPCS